MIKRVRIRGYKSLDEVDVRLAPLTIVFGSNAAGKSNLLDALALLSRLATSETLDAAFKSHRGAPLEAFTFERGGVAELQRRPVASFSISVDIELSDLVVDGVEAELRELEPGLAPASRVLERLLRYSLTIQINTASGQLQVLSERAEAIDEGGLPKSGRRFLGDEPEMRERRLLLSEARGAGHRTREIIGPKQTALSKALDPASYPHLAALREELARWRVYFLDPAAMRQETALRNVDSLGTDGSDIAAFYNTLQVEQPLQFGAFVKALQHAISSVSGLEVERTSEGYLRLVLDEGGIAVPSRLMSEGTLRYLGLLAITNPLSPLRFVGIEEPENGIDPRRLAFVARLLTAAVDRGSTQFLVNTHSPVLPEYFLGEDSAGLVHSRKVGARTIFETFSATGSLYQEEIRAALEDQPITPFRDRIVRGDFGG
jgi:predicted ATPase